jgi:hypothetical protein
MLSVNNWILTYIFVCVHVCVSGAEQMVHLDFA